jgi:hypothetical protein
MLLFAIYISPDNDQYNQYKKCCGLENSHIHQLTVV